jgi:hypothetical protein
LIRCARSLLDICLAVDEDLVRAQKSSRLSIA